MFSKLLDVLLGKKRATREFHEQKVGAFRGVPMLGLDALGSAAYGPEAALTILLPLGAMGIRYIVPIMLLILGVLGTLYFSYRQTIAAYPHGGGSYTVAGENLGPKAGLFAAAALLLDYALDVAVGISAGIGALISAVPQLKPYTLVACLVVLVFIVLVNLRGVKESGTAFAAPTYGFLVCLGVVLTVGIFKSVASGGHPQHAIDPHPLKQAVEGYSLWLLVRAFASGCTAMTGVEAVSNGMMVFKDPPVKHAQRTLTIICTALGVLLIGIAYLCTTYHIGATVPESKEYESILSQLTAAVVGRNWFYYVTIGCILSVLTLSANTGFADFPRLCRLLGRDGYLPRAFEDLSRRLVFSIGILVLAAIAAGLLIIFRGVTDRLIPLFAVGAFLAFTLSQAGMVVHWKREGGKHAKLSMAINAVGCVATSITLVVVLVAKFTEGAWITAIIISLLLLLFTRVRAHYDRVARDVSYTSPVQLEGIPPTVVVTVSRWNAITARAIQFASTLSEDLHCLHISTSDEETKKLFENWKKYVEEPFKDSKRDAPCLTVVNSPFRELQRPLLDYVNKLNQERTNRQVAVVIPELVTRSWFSALLHRQYASQLKDALLKEGEDGVVVISVPWHFES